MLQRWDAPPNDQKRQRIDELVDIIFRSDDQVIVKNLASHVHLCSRQVERQFQEIVGFTAKRLCQFRRFNEMLGSLTFDDDQDWADIAINSGSSDQAI